MADIAIPHDEPAAVRKAIFYVFGLTFAVYQVALVAACFIVFIYPRPPRALLTKLLTDHFPSIVGLPCAALMAFAIVWVLRITEGPMEWEAPGFKFRGASGPAVLWVVTFLAIAAAISMSW